MYSVTCVYSKWSENHNQFPAVFEGDTFTHQGEMWKAVIQTIHVVMIVVNQAKSLNP